MPASASSSPAEELVQQAESAFKRGDLTAAVGHFKEAKDVAGGEAMASQIKRGEQKLVEALETRGINLNRTPRLKCDMGELTKLDISPQEGFMLTRVDGSYDLKSILRISPMPKVEVLLLFWRLRESGHIAL